MEKGTNYLCFNCDYRWTSLPRPYGPQCSRCGASGSELGKIVGVEEPKRPNKPSCGPSDTTHTGCKSQETDLEEAKERAFEQLEHIMECPSPETTEVAMMLGMIHDLLKLEVVYFSE